MLIRFRNIRPLGLNGCELEVVAPSARAELLWLKDNTLGSNHSEDFVDLAAMLYVAFVIPVNTDVSRVPITGAGNIDTDKFSSTSPVVASSGRL